ncbi:hypothetical protein EMMF5_006619, partial [Cystobasidiomycetes sp. EMM_F5]
MAQLKINELYTAEILNAVKEIRECRSLAQSRIILFADNRDYKSVAKLETFRIRELRRRKAAQDYTTAYNALQELHIKA